MIQMMVLLSSALMSLFYIILHILLTESHFKIWHYQTFFPKNPCVLMFFVIITIYFKI